MMIHLNENLVHPIFTTCAATKIHLTRYDLACSLNASNVKVPFAVQRNPTDLIF